VDYDELMVFYWEMRTGKEANFDVLFEILTRKL
jgi:hypothetical protein